MRIRSCCFGRLVSTTLIVAAAADCDHAKYASSAPEKSAPTASQPSHVVPTSRSSDVSATSKPQDNSAGNALRNALPNLDHLPITTRRRIGRLRDALTAAPGSSDIPAQLGIMFLTNNMEKEAIPLLEEAANKSPRQQANWYLLGIALASQKYNNRAESAFRKAIELDPEAEFPRMRLATLLLQCNKPAAINEFQAVAGLKSVTALTLTQVAEALHELGDTEKALAICRMAVEREPDCATAHKAFSALLARQGLMSDAERERKLGTGPGECTESLDKTLLQATALGNPTRAGISRAMALAELGRFDAALTLLETVALEDPQDLDILLARARVQQARGSTDSAVGSYGEILNIEPGKIEAVVEISRILMQLRRFAEAEKIISRALAEKPDTPDLLFIRGRYLANTQQVDDAISVYRRWIESRQNDPNARMEFARALVDMRRLGEATREIDELVRTEATAAAALTLRGRVKALQGDFPGAESDMRDAVAKDPSSAVSYSTLAIMLVERKQFDRAIELLRDGIKTQRGDAALMNALGWLLATAPQSNLRNGREARELATLACAQSHFSHHAYLDTLGAACAEASDFESAKNAARMAIDLARRGGEKETAQEYGTRLSLYLAGKPYRLQE